jgi:DNA repair protein RecO (recombination protein O)
LHTAYASYWIELTELWLEERVQHPSLFELLVELLHQLDAQHYDREILNLQFQLKFLQLAGLTPDFHHCSHCRRVIQGLRAGRIGFHIAAGGLICPACHGSGVGDSVQLSSGTLKHLIWILEKSLTQGRRIIMLPASLADAKQMLEMFIPYHLGKRIKTLEFLQKLRISASDKC